MRIWMKLMVVLLLATVVPLVAVSLVFYFTTREVLTRQILQHLESVATIQQRRVKTDIERNQERLEHFLSRLQMRIELDAFNRTGRAKSLEFLDKLIRSAQSGVPGFRTISLLNPEGTVVVSTDTALRGTNLSDEPFVRAGRERTSVTTFMKGHSGQVRLILTGPLLLDGRLVGIAVIGSEAETFFAIARDYAGLGMSGETAIAKREPEGTIVYLTPLRFDPHASLTRTTDREQGTLISDSVSGHQGVFTRAVDYRGVPVFAVTKPIEEAGWGLVVKIDKNEALAPLARMRQLLLFSTLIVAAAAVGLSFVIARTITQPIVRLAGVADRISGGDFSFPIIVTSTDEVGILSRAFRRMTDALLEANAALERRVIERTADLERANKELEAFSYSVSHDLRAPLRAIDGFSRILIEDHSHLLDPEARRVLSVVCASSKHMGKLIDDLLAFSRLSRAELEKSRVDMTALARAVVDELWREDSGQPAPVVVPSLPPARASEPMIRQVFANLIGNALKYSQIRPAPLVELGSYHEPEETVYYVRDNGVGFDMQYAGKLFGVFQRMHRQDQFEGTGIGLAIVARIIGRHGGRVWAEGEVDKGATFYFTLPKGEERCTP